MNRNSANKSYGENAYKEKTAFFWSMYWVALASMPDELICDMFKDTQEPRNKGALGKVLNYWVIAGPDFSSLVKTGILLRWGQ